MQGLNNVTARRYNKKTAVQIAHCAEKLADSELSSKVKCFIAEYLNAASSRGGYSDPNYVHQLKTNPNVAQQQIATLADA
ncbi:hypothetical protein Q8V93_004621 [Enterobacter asburiae]|nr:hypothetical protein [Enterobacter asburiae]